MSRRATRPGVAAICLARASRVAFVQQETCGVISPFGNGWNGCVISPGTAGWRGTPCSRLAGNVRGNPTLSTIQSLVPAAAIIGRRGEAIQFPWKELVLGDRPRILCVVNDAPKYPASGSNGSVLGRLLKEWRGRRGYSQLDLALAASTTQRHVSFIESGRAAPSREMILRIAATMNLPLRQQNALLLAAGYAPAWAQRDLTEPDLAMVNSALDFMLAKHEPFPAFVVDRRWNLLRANRGALSLIEFLTGPPSSEPAAEPANLAFALMSPEGLRPFISNWEEVAHYFLRGVQADAQEDGTPETLTLLNRLLALPDILALSEGPPPTITHAPVLPIHIRGGEVPLALFTTIATLGTPRDVTLQEVRIECFFPMDDATSQCFHAWARGN
jgi:transcriptional regulator with XRE-family HTH domain